LPDEEEVDAVEAAGAPGCIERPPMPSDREDRIDWFGGERAFPSMGPRSQEPVEDEARAERLSRLRVGMERALLGDCCAGSPAWGVGLFDMVTLHVLTDEAC
jgi:hypothetical protein